MLYVLMTDSGIAKKSRCWFRLRVTKPKSCTKRPPIMPQLSIKNTKRSFCINKEAAMNTYDFCHHYSFNYVKGRLWKKTPCTSSLVPAYFWKVHIKCRETLPFQSVPLCMYLRIWRRANMGSISPPVTNRRQKEGNISNDVISVVLRGGDFLVSEWTQRIRSVFVLKK